jgi:hypothetical protein
MTYTELRNAILGLLPEAELLEDYEGQLLIFTNKVVGEDLQLLPFDPED